MSDPNDAELLRGASPEEEGIPELQGDPPGKVLADDVPDEIVPPRDFPIGAEEYGTTAGEEALGESLAQRVAREEPDLGRRLTADDDPLAGRLVQPDAGMLDVDEVPEEVGDLTGDVAGLSAEEEAVHIEEEPAGMGGGWPGYLDENED